MRLFTLLITSLLISSALSAQQKGDILVGGTVGFNRTKTNDFLDSSRSTTIYLAPSIGKFYRTNRMAGISLDLGKTSFKDKNAKSSSYGGGVFLRQYQPLGKSFYLFAQEGIWAQFLNSHAYYFTDLSYIQKTKSQYAGLYFYPGVAYGLTKKLQLEVAFTQMVSLYYSHSKSEILNYPEPNKKSGSAISLNTGFNETLTGYLTFGAKWMVSKSKSEK
jgi:hypothetical protein